MNLLDSIAGELVAAAVVTIVLQVTFVLAVTCGVACLMRRNAAARHAVCLAGLVLAVACPLVAVNAGAFGWTWLRIDWPVEATDESDVEPEPLIMDEPRLPAEYETAVAAWAPPETELVMQDPERPVTETITVPPDVLYRPGETDPVDDSNEIAPVESSMSTTPRNSDSVASVPASASIDAVDAAPAQGMNINYATIVRIAVGYGLLVWLLGAMIQIGRWRIGCGRLKGMLRGVVELDRTRFGALIAAAAAAVGLRRPPKNLSGPLVPIPMVYGVWRARVLLPQPFVEGARPLELRDVLIHEFAHVRRRDPWISLLQRFVAVLYWPHPLVHVLNRQLAGAREELCDNYVLREGRGTAFAEILLSLSEQLQGLGAPVGLLGLVSRRGRLEARVSGILDQRRRTGTRMGRGSAVLLVAAGVGLLCATVGIRAGNEFSESEDAVIVQPSGETADPGDAEEVEAASTDQIVSADESTIAERHIRGIVTDEDGMPVSGAIVKFTLSSLSDRRTTTGQAGRFDLPIPDDRQRSSWELLAEDATGEQLGQAIVDDPVGRGDLATQIMLRPARVVTTHVKDHLDQPVPGAIVTVVGRSKVGEGVTDARGSVDVRYPDGIDVRWLLARRGGVGFDYFQNDTSTAVLHPGPLPDEVTLQLDGARSVEVQVVNSTGEPVTAAYVYAWTIKMPGKTRDANLSGVMTFPVDASGTVQFDWLPRQFDDGISFVAWSQGAHAPEYAVLRPGDEESRLTIEVLRDAQISGRVTYTDGRPAAGIRVIAYGDGYAPYSGDGKSTFTDEQGRYDLSVNSNAAYLVAVQEAEWATAAVSTDLLSEDESVANLDLTLIPGTLITGQITEGNDRSPVVDESVTLSQDGERLPEITGRPIRQRRLYYRVRTDETGRYSFRVGPGEYRLRIRDERPHGPEPLRITDEGGRLEFDQHFEGPRYLSLSGHVVSHADAMPLADATVYVSRTGDDDFPTRMLVKTDEVGQFRVDRLRPENMIYAHSADGSLAGLLVVGAEMSEITLELSPAVTVVGQLLDDDGKPLANVEVAGHVRSANVESECAAIRTETDENGRYRIPGVAVGAHFKLVAMRTHYGSARHRNPVRIFTESGEVEIDPYSVPRKVEEVNATSESDGDTRINVPSVLEHLRLNCHPWINTPTEQLRSLQYTYTLGNDERQVELVRGVSDAPPSMWYGSTLGTGLHWLLRHPERFDVTVARLESELNRLQLTIRSKPDQQGIHLEIGNGISGSWRGYFSHGSDEMTLVVDAEHMLPLRESHRFGGEAKITEIQYLDWQRVSDDGWIPRRVDVTHGEAVYHMHFAWKEGVAWLLTHAETEYEGNTQEVARVSDVVVNDEELIQRSREEQGRQEAAAGVVRTVLEHNRPWLANDLSGLDSLSYTFHTLREDVKEQCVVTDDGTVAMQVTHDGQGKMGDRLGERQTALPSGEWARAQRDDRFALIHDPSEQDRGQPYAEQIQHYGRIGCQFDLPLFRYDEFLDGATVEIEDGEWNGTPCHVATVRALGRDVYFGCGTMLGFTSWSYVHHIRPAYETIYIDRERNVPLHETLVSSWENKRFEIDFSDYREVEPGQWAPLSIRVESPDYFTCEMTYQLVEGRHWVLSEVESWFDPDNRSRGVVEDVAVNQPSELRDAVLEQIEATRAVFGDAGEAVSQTVEVPTHPFVLGRQVRVGSLEVLFTLNPAGELIVQCAPAEGQTIEAGRSVSVLLLDEADRILNAAQEPFMKRGGRFEAVAGFGRSTGLANVSRYVICSDDGYIDDLSSTVRQLRVRPSAGPADLTTLAPVADESGKTSVIEVAVRPEDDGQAVAAVHFASQDRLNEFGLDVSVGVFNREGRLIAAGAKPGTLLVKSNIVEETWEVPLPHLESGADFDRVAVGLSRGQTYSAPTGTLWGRFMTNYPIFDVETMLAAEDTGCWQVGLEELEERVRDEVLQRGLLDSVRDWKEQVAEQRTHHDLLRPRVERLLHILGRTEEPQLLAAAIRLLGLSGDQGAATSVRSHLDSADPGVRDVAAIALGMLGEADVLPAIESVLSRDVPSFADDPEGYRRHRARGNDALIALVMLRTDESVSLVRELLLESLGRIEYVPLDNGGYSWRGTHLPDALAKLMGCITDPRYVAVLTDALATIEDQRPGDGRFSTDEFVTALHEYGDAARAAIVSRVRNGDLSVLPSRDPYYVPMVRDAMLAGGTPAETLYPGVRYLWNAGTDEAIEALRSVYETRPPQDPRTRLYLCEALAYHGDDRGLPEAFELLVAACAPEEPPEDADARRQWERERENARDDPLDVFERAKTVSRIAVVEQHLEAEDVATQIACVEVLGTLRGAMPEPVRETLESWSGSDNLEVSTGATLLLQRQ